MQNSTVLAELRGMPGVPPYLFLKHLEPVCCEYPTPGAGVSDAPLHEESQRVADRSQKPKIRPLLRARCPTSAAARRLDSDVHGFSLIGPHPASFEFSCLIESQSQGEEIHLTFGILVLIVSC